MKPDPDGDKVLIIAHLFGVKIRGDAPAAICDAAAELVRLLPAGSFQLSDDAEEALKGHVGRLGIKYTGSGHFIPIFRDVMAELIHD